MNKDKFQDIRQLVKQQLGVVTAVLSFLVLTTSAIQSLAEDFRTSALVILSIFSLVLLVATYSILTAKEISSIEPRIQSRRYSLAFRFSAISLSILLLLCSWTVALLPMSPKYYGFLLYKMGNCKTAEEQFLLYHENSTGTPESYLSLADCYQKQNDYLKYVAILESALTRESLFADDVAKKGEFHSRAGQALVVNSYELQYITKHNRLPQNLYARASRHFNLAQLYRGEDVVDYWVLGVATAIQLKDDKNTNQAKVEVLSVFEKALRFLTGGVITTQWLQDRLAVLIDAASGFPEELDPYRDLIAEHHYWLGKAYYEMGNFTEAENAFKIGLGLLSSKAQYEDKYLVKLAQVDIFRNLLESQASSVNVDDYAGRLSDPDLLAQTLFLVGLKAWYEAAQLQGEEGFQAKRDTAEKFLTEAFRLGEAQFRTALLLATLYRMDNDFSRAKTQYELAIAASPDAAVAYRGMVFTLFAAGNLSEAKLYAKRWTELAPGSAEAHFRYSLLSEEDDIDLAIKESERAVQIDPTNPQQYYVLALQRRKKGAEFDANSEQYTSLTEKALDAINHSIGLLAKRGDSKFKRSAERERASIWNTLAYAYANQRRNLLLAEEYIDSALRTVRDEPRMLDTKAWVLLMQLESKQNGDVSENRLTTAKELLNKTLTLLTAEDTQSKAEVLFHLGYLEQMRGDLAAARVAYIQALELNPQYTEAKAGLSQTGP